MTKVSRKNSRGFTFVELLAVVLVLAVLAAVAIPIYMNSRRASAARTCRANIGTIARAASAFALRNSGYPLTVAALNGVPEGLETDIRCPLTQTNRYVIATTAGGTTAPTSGDGPIFINCQDAALHNDATNAAVTEWQKQLPALPATSEGTL
jgi:type IV pilus assembly protein PilA